MINKFLLLLTVMVLLAACGSGSQAENRANPVPQTGQDAGSANSGCQPSPPDMLGPYYEPGAPLRDSVGQGYVLEGQVLQAETCVPLPGAQVEFWLAGPDGEYGDDYRATLKVGDDGSYRFESHPPPPYAGRPSHIHIRVEAQGHKTLVTQHYPEQGSTSAVFDLVLLTE